MNKIFLFIFCLISAKAFSQEPSWLWAKSALGTDNEQGYAVKVDDRGNVYACGYFNSPTISFDNYTLNLGFDYERAFIVKYNANGAVQWAVAPYGETEALDMTIDPVGNIYVCGLMRDNVSFGTYSFSSSGSTDGFIAKYDTSGNVIWAKKMGGGDVDYYNNIVADPNGNIVVTGSFYSASLSIGNMTLTNTDNLNDLFVVSYDTAGTFNWVKKYGGICSSQTSDIACDASGNIAVTGFYFNSSMYFGNLSIPNAGDQDAFIAVYNNAGNILWAKGVGGVNEEFGNAVTFDKNGNLILAGIFESQVLTIDTNMLSNSGIIDPFIISYNPSGAVNWAKKYGGTGAESIGSICADKAGNIYTIGYFDSPSILWDSDSVYNSGVADVLLNKFDSLGNLVWAKSNDASIATNDLSVDAAGNLYTTGWYNTSLIYLDAVFLYNFGYGDFYVGKLAPSTTGIYALTLANDFNVYPNPSDDNIFIKTNISGHDKRLLLYDMFGSVLKEIQITSNITEIEREGLPSGMYILEIHEKNVLKEHQKMILR